MDLEKRIVELEKKCITLGKAVEEVKEQPIRINRKKLVESITSNISYAIERDMETCAAKLMQDENKSAHILERRTSVRTRQSLKIKLKNVSTEELAEELAKRFIAGDTRLHVIEENEKTYTVQVAEYIPAIRGLFLDASKGCFLTYEEEVIAQQFLQSLIGSSVHRATKLIEICKDALQFQEIK